MYDLAGFCYLTLSLLALIEAPYKTPNIRTVNHLVHFCALAGLAFKYLSQ